MSAIVPTNHLSSPFNCAALSVWVGITDDLRCCSFLIPWEILPFRKISATIGNQPSVVKGWNWKDMNHYSGELQEIYTLAQGPLHSGQVLKILTKPCIYQYHYKIVLINYVLHSITLQLLPLETVTVRRPRCNYNLSKIDLLTALRYKFVLTYNKLLLISFWNGKNNK